MAVEGGVYLDILARLNIAPVTAALKDLKMLLREAGKEDSEAFTSAFDLAGVKRQFEAVSQYAQTAYLDMQNGLARLQIAEANINRARAASFEQTTGAMVAAQRELDAAIANSQKLMAESMAAADMQRTMVAPVATRGGDHDRTPGDRGRSPTRDRENFLPAVGIGPEESPHKVREYGGKVSEHLAAGHIDRHIARGARASGHFLGLGAAIGTAVLAGVGLRQSTRTARNFAQVQAFHQEDTNDYINRQTQNIYGLSTQVPYDPSELSSTYKDIENQGYRGTAAIAVLKKGAQLATATGADLKTTVDGLMTSLQDFGIQTELTGNKIGSQGFAKGLADLGQQAGQLVGALSALRGFKPDELYGALGNVEPTANVYMSKMPGGGTAASAQVLSALDILAQVGISPDQASHNVSRIIGTFGSVKPNSNLYKILGALNINPQTVSEQLQTQGLFPVLDTLNQAIQNKTVKSGPNAGLVDIGWRFNQPQIDELIQQDISQLNPQQQAFLAAHPEIEAGNARTFALKKNLQQAGITEGAAGDIQTLARWYGLKAHPEQYITSGGNEYLTPGQVFQQAAGTGDIARTLAILGTHTAEGNALTDKLTGQGEDILKKAFHDVTKTLPVQWKQLGASLKSLSAQITDHVIPTVTRWVNDLTDFLQNHRDAAKALLEGMAGAAGVFLAFKTHIPQILGKLAKFGWQNLKPNALGGYGPLPNLARGQEDEAEAQSAAALNTAATNLQTTSSTFNEAIASFKEAVAIFADAAKMFSGGSDNLERSGTALNSSAEQLDGAATDLKTVATVGKDAQAAAAVPEGAAVIPGRSSGRSGILGKFGGKGLGGKGLGNMAGMLGTSMLMPDHVGGLPNELTAGLNTAAGLSWLAGPEVGAPVTATVATVELIASMVHAGNINLTGPVSGVNFPRDLGYTQHWNYSYGPGGDYLPGVLNNLPHNGPLTLPKPPMAPLTTPAQSAPGIPALAPMDTGKAHGGIVGFKGGGQAPGDQPLLSIPDKGYDTVLGMLPNGAPVGLRGGEGILTPDAVQRIGGPEALDALNNPWADPWKVGTTFYGSFAKGVAKYSPWGKYLTATSQTLDSLRDEFDKSTRVHEGSGGGKGSLYQRLLGIAAGDGSWPLTDKGTPRGKSGIVNAVKQAYMEAGFPPDQWKDIEHIISHESGWNPTAKNPSSGAYGLGQFLGHQGDKYGAIGAYSGDPLQEARAMMAYISDRYGSPAAAWSYWQGHHAYSRGGIIGFSRGGLAPQAGGQALIDDPRYSNLHEINPITGGPQRYLMHDKYSDGVPTDASDKSGAWSRIFGKSFGSNDNWDWQSFFQDAPGGRDEHRWNTNIYQHDPGINRWQEPWDGGQGTYNLPGGGVGAYRPGSHVLHAAHGGIIGFSGGGAVPAFWDPKYPNPIHTNVTHKNTYDRGIYAPMTPRDHAGVGPYNKTHFGYFASVPDGPNNNRRPWDTDPYSGGYGISNRAAPTWDINESPDWFHHMRQHFANGGVVGFAGGGMPQAPIPLSPNNTTPVPKPPPKPPTPQRKAPVKPGPPAGSKAPTAPKKGDHHAPPNAGVKKGDSIAEKGLKAEKHPKSFTPDGTKPGQYTSPGDDRKLHGSSSRQPGLNNTSKGFNIGGGLVGAAESAATTAANVFAPGSGQAANMAFALANRAVGYAGQLVGIGIEGLMETFLPNNSPLADPTNNILGKVALGIAGAHPSPKNTAGNTAMKMKPKQNLDAGEMAGKQLPGIHIENVHNHGQQDWGGLQKAMVGASFGLPTGNSS